jgi:hypothetical protein
MARGWESKSVEAQIEESSSKSTNGNNGSLTPEETQARMRRSSLLLSRAGIARQLEGSTNERYSELLRRTLAALDTQLAETK